MAAAAKPKDKGALVALLASAPKSSSEEETTTPTDHGFRAVAKAFGIPPEKEASAQAALKQYIKTCTSSPLGSEAESDEEY